MRAQGLRLLVAGAICTCALFIASPAIAAAAREGQGHPEQKQNVRIHDLEKDVDEHEKIITYLLFPVTVLVGILSLGGAIGIVFSIRDQRRVSQLHELSVAGEMSSQRRTEQSYSSFFEQSQTTLSLVNETLQLAKEATDQAAKSMDEKVQVRVDAIDEKAQRLMLELFNTHEFDIVVFDHGRRHELQEIAAELRTLEGYLSLQNIKLGEYTKFVKAIDQFIQGETEAALAALQVASQEPIVGDLQKFIEYWVGYILTTVGQYGEAIERFEHDELNLPDTSSQHFQLERIVIETEFFLIAKPKATGEIATNGTGPEKVDDATKGKPADSRPPLVRFEAVASLLKKLDALEVKLKANRTRDDHTHTLVEVARTQADIYEWIAYDPAHLDEPIHKDVVDRTIDIVDDDDPHATEEEEFVGSSLWDELGEDDLFRCWALLRAQKICEQAQREKKSADIAFALAECHFKLQNPNAFSEFKKADDELHGEIGEHREQRRDASLLQSVLICHCRLLKLEQEDAAEAAASQGQQPEDQEMQQREIGAIRTNQRAVSDAVKAMGRGRVTIFSQIQRRNLTQEEFNTEVGAIVNQMGLGSGDAGQTRDGFGVGATEGT